MRGYSYDRRDVTGRGLANAYAQTLGTIFSSGGEKPYEVELFVAEVGSTQSDDQLYRLTYDGSVADEHHYAVMGGSADKISNYLKSAYKDGLDLSGALAVAIDALGNDGTEPRALSAPELEIAVLDRTRQQPRKFRRVEGPRLTVLLEQTNPTDPAETAESPESPGSADAAEPDPADTIGDLPDV